MRWCVILNSESVDERTVVTKTGGLNVSFKC